jgi:hypothetical protein
MSTTYELVWRPRWLKLVAYRVARPRILHVGWNRSGDGENRRRIIGAGVVVSRWCVSLSWARTIRRPARNR